MGNHCCGGRGSKEPLGWDGGLFVGGVFGLLLCKMLAEFTQHDQLATVLAWICGGLALIGVLVCWFRPRPKKKCDHHDHHD